MSAIETDRSSISVGGVGGVAAQILSYLTGWNDTRVTRRALGRLSDRELDDIGLCRGDIDRIARRF